MMKKNFLLFVCVILLSSCHQTKSGMVKELIDTSNEYDKEETGNILLNMLIYQYLTRKNTGLMLTFKEPIYQEIVLFIGN